MKNRRGVPSPSRAPGAISAAALAARALPPLGHLRRRMSPPQTVRPPRRPGASRRDIICFSKADARRPVPPGASPVVADVAAVTAAVAAPTLVLQHHIVSLGPVGVPDVELEIHQEPRLTGALGDARARRFASEVLLVEEDVAPRLLADDEAVATRRVIILDVASGATAGSTALDHSGRGPSRPDPLT